MTARSAPRTARRNTAISRASSAPWATSSAAAPGGSTPGASTSPPAYAVDTSTVVSTPSPGHGDSWATITVVLATRKTQLVASGSTAAEASRPCARQSRTATAASATTGAGRQPRSSTAAYAPAQAAPSSTATTTQPADAGAASPANAAAPPATAAPARSPTAHRASSRSNACRAARLPVAGMGGHSLRAADGL